MGLGLAACGGGTGVSDSGSQSSSTGQNPIGGGGQSSGTTGTTSALVQYTPNQAKWSTFAAKPLAGGTILAHDPNGVGWLTPSSWSAAQWSGEIYNPSKMTKDAFAAAICPSGDQIRGIQEVFYQRKPFADVKNPTKAEVDEWHRIAINHVRALVGYTSEDRQVKKTTVCLRVHSGVTSENSPLSGTPGTLARWDLP